MALSDFPQTGLTTGQTVTVNGNQYTWDGEKWVGAFTQISLNGIQSVDIVDGTITVADIADNAIETAKIADNAVTTAKIVDNAITGAKIANGTITAPDLAEDATTALPNGTDGQLLSSDGDGNFSWVDAPTGGGGSTTSVITATFSQFVGRGTTSQTRTVTIPTPGTSVNVNYDVTITDQSVGGNQGQGRGTITFTANSGATATFINDTNGNRTGNVTMATPNATTTFTISAAMTFNAGDSDHRQQHTINTLELTDTTTNNYTAT